MGYRTVDELENFDLKDAHISNMEISSGHLFVTLDIVTIKSSNSCNRDIRDMRTNDLEFKLQDAQIEYMIKEGYKLYNADGVLQNEVPDEQIAPENYTAAMKELVECYVYEITKEQEGYLIDIDGEESTYKIKVKASHDVEEWEKFLSKDTM